MKIDKKRIILRHGWRYLTAWGKCVRRLERTTRKVISKLSIFPLIFLSHTQKRAVGGWFSILEAGEKGKAPESWNKWDLVSRWLLRYFTLRSLWYFRLVSKWLSGVDGDQSLDRWAGGKLPVFKWQWSINLKIIDETADMIAEGSLEIVKSSAWSLICNCADLWSVMGRSSFGVQLLLLMDAGWRA